MSCRLEREHGHQSDNLKKSSKKPVSPTEDLMSQVIRMTGIPARTIRKELNAILKRKGLDPKKLTLDQLRAVVASYLREIMASMLEAKNKPESGH
jgi:hypothetical protein